MNTQSLKNREVSDLREPMVRVERTYQDLPGLNSETKDVLQQMERSLASLEELAGRLSFVLSEVRSLVRR